MVNSKKTKETIDIQLNFILEIKLIKEYFLAK